MDTTEKYIEMCSAAKEIQKLVPRDHHGSAGGDKSFFGYSEKLNGMVWLPRQDQLQKMLDWENEGECGVVLIDAFYNFVKHRYDASPFNNTNSSWEQLWLAFVMHEKYNKTWDGKGWE
ncbi:hypothetical protein KA005_24580 [bacterium]|nr:hypothetical protein [bacterium]